VRQLIICTFFLSSCFLGIEGNDTISSSEAARAIKEAAFTNVVRCHPEVLENKGSYPVFSLTQILCLTEADEYNLLRRSDVDGCVDRTLVFPCQESIDKTALFTAFFANHCPISTVNMPSTTVSHPFQGNAIPKSNSELFWYGCL